MQLRVDCLKDRREAEGKVKRDIGEQVASVEASLKRQVAEASHTVSSEALAEAMEREAQAVRGGRAGERA